MKAIKILELAKISSCAVSSLIAIVGQPESSRENTQDQGAAPGMGAASQADRSRQVLESLVGQWTVSIEKGPGTPGASLGPASQDTAIPARVSVQRDWAFNSAFVQESVFLADTPDSNGLGLTYFWGYNPELNRYNLVRLDSATGAASVMYGQWNSASRSIVFRGQSPSGSGQQDDAAVLRFAGDDTQIVEIFGGNLASGAGSRRQATAPGNDQPSQPALPADTDPGAGRGTEKLPQMMPPDRPSPADADPGSLPLDDAHLIMRIRYTRVGSQQSDASDPPAGR